MEPLGDPLQSHPLAAPTEEAARVPRRFGVGVLMILVTVFAVLFAVLNMLDADPRVFSIVGVLFLGVTAAQVLLFGGERPRQASIVAGAVLLPLAIFVVVMADALRRGANVGSAIGGALAGGLLCALPSGAICGYLAG